MKYLIILRYNKQQTPADDRNIFFRVSVAFINAKTKFVFSQHFALSQIYFMSYSA